MQDHLDQRLVKRMHHDFGIELPWAIGQRKSRFCIRQQTIEEDFGL